MSGLKLILNASKKHLEAYNDYLGAEELADKQKINNVAELIKMIELYLKAMFDIENEEQ